MCLSYLPAHVPHQHNVFNAVDWNHVTNHIVNSVCCLNLNIEAKLISPIFW